MEFNSRKIAFVFVVTLFFTQANSWGKLQEFKESKETYKVEVPDQWTAIEGLLDVPLSVVSKTGSEGNRAVVSVVPMYKDDGSFKKLDKNGDDYISQKEDWLDAIDGEALSWDDYHEQKIDGATVYSIGVTYKVDHGTFHDRTYFVLNKNKKLFYIKTMVPKDLEASQNKHVNEIVRSIASVE